MHHQWESQRKTMKIINHWYDKWNLTIKQRTLMGLNMLNWLSILKITKSWNRWVLFLDLNFKSAVLFLFVLSHSPSAEMLCRQNGSYSPSMTWASALLPTVETWSRYQMASCSILPPGHRHNPLPSFRHHASVFPSLGNDPLWFVRA